MCDVRLCAAALKMQEYWSFPGRQVKEKAEAKRDGNIRVPSEGEMLQTILRRAKHSLKCCVILPILTLAYLTSGQIGMTK